jgi:hypothetical protein
VLVEKGGLEMADVQISRWLWRKSYSVSKLLKLNSILLVTTFPLVAFGRSNDLDMVWSAGW